MSDTAQTLDRGLKLLRLAAEHPEGLTVTQAATALGVGRTVVYRLAATLAEHAMLRRDIAGRLRLGPGVLDLAARAQPQLAQVARPSVHRLAEACGATAHLTVADGDEALALLVVEPTWTRFHVAYRTGSRHTLERGAAGRAILAGRSGRSGVVTSSGELEAGAHGIAAPIVGVPGLSASVGVVALSALDMAAVGPQVLSAAESVAQALRAER